MSRNRVLWQTLSVMLRNAEQHPSICAEFKPKLTYETKFWHYKGWAHRATAVGLQFTGKLEQQTVFDLRVIVHVMTY